jgi:hypothetical protein
MIDTAIPNIDGITVVITIDTTAVTPSQNAKPLTCILIVSLLLRPYYGLREPRRLTAVIPTHTMRHD